MADIRGIHVSPGIYMSETVDMKTATNSLGVSKVGLVGETLKGPAFQKYWVHGYEEYNKVFGGTSSKKFTGSGYLQYEAPYIAKEFLSEGTELCVVRILGFSGYNAGPAWLITGSNDDNKEHVIAVLRARGYYGYDRDNDSGTTSCTLNSKAYDAINYEFGKTSASDVVTFSAYQNLSKDDNNCSNITLVNKSGTFEASVGDLGRFNINVATTSGMKTYPVSLNKNDKDYIIKVLGQTNNDGTAPLFVESMYDVAWENDVITKGYNQIKNSPTVYEANYLADSTIKTEVDGLLTIDSTKLRKRDIGKRFLYEGGNDVIFSAYNETWNEVADKKAGDIYTVALNSDNTPQYQLAKDEDKLGAGIVYNKVEALYYKKVGNSVKAINLDLNDYKSSYRYSSTPWVVSQLMGDSMNIKMNKLFRFHTISDGASSLNEVKVSIENIKPDEACFDVVVRAYNDIDTNPVILERFNKCTMSSGKKFIGYMIGTIDGVYESKSQYITVELCEEADNNGNIPCGFLGYSVPQYNGYGIGTGSTKSCTLSPILYNTSVNGNILDKKYYFGLSDKTGFDIDYFTYKGRMASLEGPSFVGHGFHLDYRLSFSGTTNTVDGVSGYTFDCVGAITQEKSDYPRITSEDDMTNTIYGDVKFRKFTMHFAGGFDGWDIYRDCRTNTNEYSYDDYKGYVNKNNGIGYAFDTFSSATDTSLFNIEGGALTSDYYSVLAGVSLLKNPEEVDINLLATPGIDVVNNSKLVSEIFDMLEDRADTLYFPTMPDKAYGASDYEDDIQSVSESIMDVIDTELHSTYAAIYYPWVKIEDNGTYVWLPPTGKILKNIAKSDNTNTTMNNAPAGLTRGKINAVRARKNLKVAECDALYEAGINPIRTYSQEGIIVMGQKTMGGDDNPLNRIDVRRLMLRLRKLVAIGTLGLIFEPNDNTTAQTLQSILKGILDGFVSNRAVQKYKIVLDTSEEAKDRLELPGKIYVMPYRALEYIPLNFTVTDKGSYFTD